MSTVVKQANNDISRKYRGSKLREVKFLHCADIHLDMPFTSLGIEDGKPSIRRMDLKDTFQKIMNIAKEERVEILFICGDLYEHDYVRKSTISFINQAFLNISDKKVFIIPGNHDPWVKGSYYMNYEWANNVYILNGENPYVHFEEEGISVYSSCVFFKNEPDAILKYGPDAFHKEPTGLLEGTNCDNTGIKPENMGTGYGKVKAGPNSLLINHDNINILLAHGTVDLDIDGNSYNPMTSLELAALGIDYVALGHFHKRIDNIGGKGIIYNPGSPEPLGFDEPGEHGVYIGTIVKKEVNSSNYSNHSDHLDHLNYLNRPVNLNCIGNLNNLNQLQYLNQPVNLNCQNHMNHLNKPVNFYNSGCSSYLNIEFKALNKRCYNELMIDITGCDTDEKVTAKIMDGVKMLSSDLQSNLSSLLLNVILYGYIDPLYNNDMEYILSFFKDKVFYIKLRNEAVPEYDFDLIKEEPGLKGLFTRKVLDLIDKTQDDSEKELLMKSLYYGIQELEKGQVDMI